MVYNFVRKYKTRVKNMLKSKVFIFADNKRETMRRI